MFMAEYIRDKAKSMRDVDEQERFRYSSGGHISFKRSLSLEAKVEQQAMEIFASALEDLVSLLVPVEAREGFVKIIGLANECSNRTVMTTQSNTCSISLCARHAQRNLHSSTQEIVCTSASTGVLDFLPSKCEGLRKAVEIACTVITSDFYRKQNTHSTSLTKTICHL